MNENELIVSAKKGDLQAFQSLIEQYQNRIYAIALRFCRNGEDAWDIAQEVVIKIYRVIKRYRGDSAFSTWVYAITKNATIDFLRKRNKKQSMETSIEACEFQVILPEFITENTWKSREDMHILGEMLRKLPKQQREVLILRDIDGYSYEEIAKILNISIGTVKSRISRGRDALRREYFKTIQ